MKRFDIDRQVGPMRLRAWFLVANFGFNALALYGLSRAMVEGSGVGILIVGILGTLGCLALLSQPNRSGTDAANSASQGGAAEREAGNNQAQP